MKPRLRIIHHLHRTGGTLISKCLASLPDIALLSEVHPDAPFMVLDPVFQASFWLRLMNDRAAAGLKNAPFDEKIATIAALAETRGETLVLRNWAYFDFFGRPFTAQPGYRLSIVDALAPHFELQQIVSVRHPLDQWLSWINYRGTARAEDFTLSEFLASCLRFHAATAAIPRFRYEDFVAAPQPQLEAICAALSLDYDPVFIERWPYYHQITGDDNDRASGGWRIETRPRRAVPPGLEEELVAIPDYRRLLHLYGY